MEESANLQLKRRMVKSTLFTIISYIVNFVSAFIISPYILARIGAERYGVMISMAIGLAWLRLMDGGMSNGFSIFFSSAHAQGDRRRFASILSSGLFFYLLFGLTIALPVIIEAPAVSRFLFGELGGSPEIVTYVRISAASFVVANFAWLFFYALAGVQRIDISSKIDIVLGIGSFTMSILLIAGGYGIIGLAWLSIAILSAHVLASLVCLYRLWSGGIFSLSLINLKRLGELLSFGWKIHVSNIVNAFLFQADRFVALYSGKVIGVTFYQFGVTIIDKMRAVAGFHIPAMMAGVTNLHSRNESAALAALFLRGIKYTMIVLIPIVLFGLLFTEELIVLWLGQSYHTSVVVFRILAGGYALYAISGMAGSVSSAMGRPDLQMKCGLLSLLVALPMYPFMVSHFEINGIAITVATSLAVYAFAILVSFFRLHAFPPADFLRAFFRVVLLSILFLLPLVAVKVMAVINSYGSSRWESLAMLLPCGAGYFLILFAFFRKWGVLDDTDVGLIRNLWS